MNCARARTSNGLFGACLVLHAAAAAAPPWVAHVKRAHRMARTSGQRDDGIAGTVPNEPGIGGSWALLLEQREVKALGGNGAVWSYLISEPDSVELGATDLSSSL